MEFLGIENLLMCVVVGLLGGLFVGLGLKLAASR